MDPMIEMIPKEMPQEMLWALVAIVVFSILIVYLWWPSNPEE